MISPFLMPALSAGDPGVGVLMTLAPRGASQPSWSDSAFVTSLVSTPSHPTFCAWAVPANNKAKTTVTMRKQEDMISPSRSQMSHVHWNGSVLEHAANKRPFAPGARLAYRSCHRKL